MSYRFRILFYMVVLLGLGVYSWVTGDRVVGAVFLFVGGLMAVFA